MNQGSTALIFLAGLLELLDFLEFLSSPIGRVGMFGLGLCWGYQYLFELNLAIAAVLAGLVSVQLYHCLKLE